jgi:hypothetical protein
MSLWIRWRNGEGDEVGIAEVVNGKRNSIQFLLVAAVITIHRIEPVNRNICISKGTQKAPGNPTWRCRMGLYKKGL